MPGTFRICLWVLIFLLGSLQSFTQNQRVKPFQPDRQEIESRYAHSVLMDSIARNTIFKSFITPHWLEDKKSFWYKNSLPGKKAEYIFVDAEKKQKRPAFDHNRLASALSKKGRAVHADSLDLSAITFTDKRMTFQMHKKIWECNLSNYSCIIKEDSIKNDRSGNQGDFNRRARWMRFQRRDSLSPDKSLKAFIRDNNVYISDSAGNNAIEFTIDGSKEKPYGMLHWSPDGKYVVGYRIDPREHKEVYHILTSKPESFRGELKSQRYAQPGDEFTSYEMFVFDPQNKKTLKVETEKYDFLGMPHLRWRTDDPRYFSFERADRGHQRFRIIEVDSKTAKTKNILEETTNTFIYEQRIFTHYIEKTNEIIWSSEKDGWRHLYLVNSLNGNISPITTGSWVVRDIDSVDEQKREVWFRASGMNAGEDPYNLHAYRIGFDGKGLIALTEGNGNHQLTYSPDKKYFLDRYSRPDMPPVTVLRRTADGSLIMEIEKADITNFLATGIELPEVFTAKGRDDKTDIWGVVFRPSDFDPAKSYPVIENIYAGPQDAFVPKNFYGYGEMQSIAELGFIVVQIDGMGTANRSKAFHDVCWKNLADAGFPDRIKWITALAEKYPQVDKDRVGLYGTSAGGQNAAGGVLFHPEFYKAAVAACGCHDNRVDKQWWNEQWMGYPVGDHYAEQSNITNAHKLKGDLFLIVGEADTNVPPESTYRLVDALIKADKNFQFLAIPGMGHSDGGEYGRKRKRDFFVKSLLGVDAPVRN